MRNFEIDPVSGPVGVIGLSRDGFIAAVENLRIASTGETLSGPSTVTFTTLQTFFTGESGAYAVTLPDGTSKGMAKELMFDGSESSTARFTVTGNIKDFTSLTFSASARTAILRWLGSKWIVLAGSAVGNS